MIIGYADLQQTDGAHNYVVVIAGAGYGYGYGYGSAGGARQTASS